METIKIISKQWSLKLRDFFNSVYLGVLIPVLFELQNVLDKGFDFSHEALIKLAKIAIASFIANIIRKLIEKSKVVTIEPLYLRDKEKETPIIINDPTRPK